MKILITGFDPFGEERINPSSESLKYLSDKILGNEIIKLEISTIAYKSINQIENAIEKERPDVVLCIGQAGGRFDISVEKVAINLNDFPINDNEGNKVIDESIYLDGENAYFATIPVKSIVEKIKQNNIPASVSYSAGTFICNHVFYGMLYLSKKKYNNIKVGFIHIPFLPEQVIDKRNMPSMSIENIVKALEIAIEVICEQDYDKKIEGGKTH